MSTATTNHIDPTNPTSKPPVSINTANKASDIIEDDLDALHKKQTMKDPHALNNATPANPDDKSKSPLRPMVKQPVTDPSPKKTEPDLTKSKRSIVGLSRGPGSLYDPFDEIAAGKSEEEVINKLRTENVKLRKELKMISDDLTVMVDKKRYEKQEVFHPPHARDYIAGTATSEKGLQKELETATKQLERLQKETAQLGNKCDAHGTYEKFQARQGHLYEIENKIQELLNQKKVVDKAFREKERVLDTLMNPSSGQNYQINAMDEDARLLRDRAREIDKRRDHLEKQAEKRKEYAQKVTEELAALKQDLKKGQDKTGFDPAKDIKSKPETPAVSKVVGDLGLKSSKKIPMFKQVEEELPCTEENFEKLKKEIKIMQKSEEMKNKKNEREAGTYQAQINAIEKSMEEASSKINERKKEVDLLTTKLKDLSRIVRHHAVAPLQEELLVSKELPDNVMKRQTSPSRGSPGRTSPNSKSRSTSKAKKEVQRPKPYHLLVEYAKHNFQSKGYRKDEKGKPVREEEGVNFNDRDIIGKQKVKMIALDIWHDDNGITGIQAVYENEKKEVIEGRTHVMNEDKSKKVAFETLEEDYLKEISGFMNKNETAIECLILRTFRGETTRIGTPGRDSKLFKFDINEMEYPAIIFGSLREDKNNSSRLARLGVLIATQSVEENIDSKEVKNEKDVSKEEQNKSQDLKDNTVVQEEIEGGEHLAKDTEHEEQEDHDNTNRRGSDAKSHKNEGDHHVEEVIGGNESRRSQGDPSPRKEQHVNA